MKPHSAYRGGSAIRVEGRETRAISHSASSRGAALVIVLSFIVLLMVVLMAYFSQSLLERQISKSSSNIALVDNFADGAVNTVIGDLRQEIADTNRSTVTDIVTGSVTNTIYYPKAASNAVPALAGSTGTNGLENLVKRSSSSNAFYPDGPAKAAASSTTSPSANGRSISAARWNKPLFIQPTATNDSTPIASAAFVPPDWIYVARDGSNPKAVSQDVIGRYAYAIYDEGGLLDANVAGYPASLGNSTDSPVPYKSALAFADLSQIGLTASQIDTLVGWRNYASAQALGDFTSYTFPDSGTVYGRSVRSNTNGFLKTSNTGIQNGRTDRMFASRQELINFLQNGVGLPATNQAFQCLTHFSRDLNQPSLAPLPASTTPDATHRPAIVAGTGGNDAVGGDAVINPVFLSVRVASAFARNDGTPAAQGDPLVKKRFPLNKLAWLTYAGPITFNGTSYNPKLDATSLTTLKTTCGFTDAFLLQGTPENIYKYFGLSWVPVTAGGVTVNAWVYSHSGTSPLSSLPAAANGSPIKTLAGVVAANREPDFFEMLKASITAGSLAKGATDPTGKDNASGGTIIFEAVQSAKDTSLDYAVIQIAANIMDQSDLDGYPTAIRFAAGGSPAVPVREFRGVENLPYFYRMQSGNVVAGMPNPNPTVSSQTNNSYDNYPVPGLTEPGLSVALLEPQIWNPHDQNSSLGSPRPQAFRLVADTAPINADGAAADSSGAAVDYNTVSFQVYDVTNGISSTYGEALTSSLAFFNNYKEDPVELNAATTALEFEVPNNTLFREPTLLIRPGVPSSSNLRLGSGNYLKTKFIGNTPNGTPWSNYFPGDGAKALNHIISADAGKSYLGIYLGIAPLRWVRTPSGSGSPSPRVYSAYRNSGLTVSTNNGDPSLTVRMQCQDANGNWITYDQKNGRVPYPSWLVVAEDGSQDTKTTVGDRRNTINNNMRSALNASADPRTSRFGMSTGWRGVADAWQSGGFTLSWLNQAESVLSSLRPSTASGGSSGYLDNSGGNAAYAFVGLPMVAGWYPTGGTTPKKNIPTGKWIFGGGNYWPGLLTQNTSSGDSYFADPDGVVRRGMAAHASSSATTGLPMAKTIGGPANQSQSRPIILNRPFRSVAELGYVFSDTPWRNLDMFTPESGFAGLLDAFSVTDTGDSAGMVAGKVNLNTRQTSVLQAVLAGAYRDEINAAAATIPGSSATSLAGTIAGALVARTTSTTAGNGPIANISEIVGKWVGSNTAANGGIDGGASYSGFSTDLTSAITGAATSASPPYAAADKTNDQNIERFQEAAMRALSGSGQTRVWNLMIDIVAQTGRFPQSATVPDKFTVDGEQRCWIHVAIDRMTGQVIDKQMEVVKE